LDFPLTIVQDVSTVVLYYQLPGKQKSKEKFNLYYNLLYKISPKLFRFKLIIINNNI